MNAAVTCRPRRVLCDVAQRVRPSIELHKPRQHLRNMPDPSTFRCSGAHLDFGLRVAAVAVSVAANCMLMLLAFRALTSRRVSVRDILPGAILAALAFQVLLSTGAFFVRTGLLGSSQVYGMFGIVLGLMAWIYLEAVIVVLVQRGAGQGAVAAVVAHPVRRGCRSDRCRPPQLHLLRQCAAVQGGPVDDSRVR